MLGADSQSRIASVVGVPKFDDDCTSRQKRLQFARVLFEVDVTVPSIDELLIEI